MAKLKSEKHVRRVLAVKGMAIRNYRRGRGWSQADLGRQAGLSIRTVSMAEAGRPIFAATLARLAKALQLDPVLLLQPEAHRPRSATEATELRPNPLEGDSKSVRLVVTVPIGGERTPLKHIVSVLRGLGCRVAKVRSRAGD